MELSMVPGGGTLQLRGAEPYSLATPTSVTGTIDDETGNLSGLTFSTPQVTIEREITDPAHADVVIEATFSQVAPGTGVVDPEGNATVQLALAVDLHIEVVLKGATTPLDIPGDCRSVPVNLILSSAAPYDPETGRVTVATTDFTVPPAPIGGPCGALVGDQVNEELSGSGHALSLLLTGVLPVPPPEGCETTTDLVVDPAGESSLGAAVMFTSTTAVVASDPECVQAASDGLALSGTVDFLRGATVIGSGELDGSGLATFTTTGLPAGTQQLRARFRGNLPFLRSPSALVEHRVTTQPVVSTNLPDFLLLQTAVEFDYTVTNSTFGADLDDVRVDLTLRSFTAFPTLERWDGIAWQPVTVLGVTPDRYAALPVFDLARGGERTERLRLTTVIPTDGPGGLTVTFEVKPSSALVLPAPSEALGAGSKSTTYHNPGRQPSTLQSLYAPDPIWPHTVRQGQTVTVEGALVTPSVSGHSLGGHFEYLLDGKVVPVGIVPNFMRPGEEVSRVPATGNASRPVLIHLPNDTPTGTRHITVRYSGDAVMQPSQVTWPFTVLPARGPSYQCFAEGIPPATFNVNVVAQANVPSSAPPGELALGNLDITVLKDRSMITAYIFWGMHNDEGPTEIGEMGLRDIRYTFSGGGTGTASTLVSANPYHLDTAPNPAPSSAVDGILAFEGETGSTTIAGAVGEIVPITLETIEIDLVAASLGVPYNVVCTPVDDAAELGRVRVAGVDLAVAPGGSVRAGQGVTLSANTGNPTGAGVAEFRDGTTALGVVPVAGGVASMTTDALPVGSRSLSVRYFPQPIAPMSVSSVVPLEVLPAFDCSTFAQPGNGAVVRLVYLELLGRCPDQAGFDYWTSRLDSGTSPAVFARSISLTPEAVGRVVDDAYDTMLGRAPDAEGRAFWVERMRAGSGRYDQLLADLAASPEFWTLSGSTRAGFVTRVYDRQLGRAPDAAGLEYWADRLASGTPRRALVLSLANQPEPLGRLVTEAYEQILGRAPGGSEQSTGTSYLRGTGDRSGLYADLIGRPEFTLRAQDFPNPED